MRALLLKIELHFISSILFLFLYDSAVGFLREIAHYPVYADISMGLTMALMGYSYILMNLIAAVLPSKKGKLCALLGYGVLGLVSLHTTPLKFLFLVPGGITVSVVTLLLWHYIDSRARGAAGSRLYGAVLGALGLVPVLGYLGARRYQEWRWLAGGVIKISIYNGVSILCTVLLYQVIQRTNIDGKIKAPYARLMLLIVLSLTAGGLFL
jgi:hypothetical protein